MTSITDYLTIRQMAEKYGVTYRTLRFYEQKGILAPRRNGAVRLYSPKEEAVLRLAMAANRLGLTLPEIGRRIDRDALTLQISAAELRDLAEAHDEEAGTARAQREECLSLAAKIEREGEHWAVLSEAAA